MQSFNYHTHTYRCGHADSSISDEEYVKLFIDKGFKKIAFTDHCPQKDKIDLRENMRMKYSQKDEYYQSIKGLKEKYKDIIDIELGFEIEYLPQLEDYLKNLKKETDKLVLGQHFILDNDQKLKIFRYHHFNYDDLIKYARLIERAMEENIPDVIVHPDLYMLSRDRFDKGAEDAAHIICKAAEKYGVPLEINLTEIVLFLNDRIKKISYPCKEFWEIATKYNVKVIYGIDAHYKNQIELYEESIKTANKLIGDVIIDKLNFCELL